LNSTFYCILSCTLLNFTFLKIIKMFKKKIRSILITSKYFKDSFLKAI
jgi:hypothetical protein